MTPDALIERRTPPAQANPAPATVTSGRGWHYREGYLVNEFLGRIGHTPAWIVEVEGSGFAPAKSAALCARLWSLVRSPRVIQRNRRRLAFVWPLVWPPPDAAARARMVEVAMQRASQLGPPTASGCGVCGREWNGGPTLVDDRARHLCPDCRERIEEERRERLPGPLTTWLWCAVAGAGGMLLQMLFGGHWAPLVLPLALVAGWLMGTANAPNFQRWPVGAPIVTGILLFVLQAAGWALLTGAELGSRDVQQLWLIFYWTLLGLPGPLLASFLAGTTGLGMAVVEKRLYRI